jgi:sterol 3beta-glucosyltransferase
MSLRKLKKQVPDLPADYAVSVIDSLADPEYVIHPSPSLNIVISITGSRGDVQPYLSLTIHLILSDSQHRIRICTHSGVRG